MAPRLAPLVWLYKITGGGEPVAFEVRLAAVADARAIAVVHVDVWRATYAGLIESATLDKLSYDAREQRWREILSLPGGGTSSFTLVAVDATDGRVVGFASGGAERERDRDFTGELLALYAFKQVHRQGVGRALFRETARRLAARGHASMLCWVLASNPARTFYERQGGVLLRSKIAAIGGHPHEEVAYGWPALPR